MDRRVSEHLSGGTKASPLIRAALSAGSAVVIARRWEGKQYDRKAERSKKNAGGSARRCPICKAQQEARSNARQPDLPGL